MNPEPQKTLYISAEAIPQYYHLPADMVLAEGKLILRDLHGAENALFERDLEALGIPCLRVEREYGPHIDAGRMKLRINAFLERIATAGRPMASAL